ncbi:MAG: hypothetical protein KAH04_07945, partial [Psychrilyobacter sp.]|nr:hypothetical protein [Psychrilyobacter sp.]
MELNNQTKKLILLLSLIFVTTVLLKSSPQMRKESDNDYYVVEFRKEGSTCEEIEKTITVEVEKKVLKLKGVLNVKSKIDELKSRNSIEVKKGKRSCSFNEISKVIFELSNSFDASVSRPLIQCDKLEKNADMIFAINFKKEEIENQYKKVESELSKLQFLSNYNSSKSDLEQIKLFHNNLNSLNRTNSINELSNKIKGWEVHREVGTISDNNKEIPLLISSTPFNKNPILNREEKWEKEKVDKKSYIKIKNQEIILLSLYFKENSNSILSSLKVRKTVNKIKTCEIEYLYDKGRINSLKTVKIGGYLLFLYLLTLLFDLYLFKIHIAHLLPLISLLLLISVKSNCTVEEIIIVTIISFYVLISIGLKINKSIFYLIALLFITLIAIENRTENSLYYFLLLIIPLLSGEIVLQIKKLRLLQIKIKYFLPLISALLAVLILIIMITENKNFKTVTLYLPAETTVNQTFKKANQIAKVLENSILKNRLFLVQTKKGEIKLHIKPISKKEISLITNRLRLLPEISAIYNDKNNKMDMKTFELSNKSRKVLFQDFKTVISEISTIEKNPIMSNYTTIDTYKIERSQLSDKHRDLDVMKKKEISTNFREPIINKIVQNEKQLDVKLVPKYKVKLNKSNSANITISKQATSLSRNKARATVFLYLAKTDDINLKLIKEKIDRLHLSTNVREINNENETKKHLSLYI